jgi:lectin-like protein
MLGPGESGSLVMLFPGDNGDDNGGATRSDAEETSVVQDAGLDASNAGDSSGEGSSGLDAGTSPIEPDAGTLPVEPDASTPPSALDAGAPPSSAPCPGLVFEGSCYEFFDEQVSWSGAEERCIAWGGHLASVESSAEDAFIGAWPALLGVPLLDGSGLWLGGTDALGEDGGFRWWDDRPLSFAGWAPDQPNNGAGVDCIEKRNDATQRWYDRRCTDGERYACERPE